MAKAKKDMIEALVNMGADGSFRGKRKLYINNWKPFDFSAKVVSLGIQRSENRGKEGAPYFLAVLEVEKAVEGEYSTGSRENREQGPLEEGQHVSVYYDLNPFMSDSDRLENNMRDVHAIAADLTGTAIGDYSKNPRLIFDQLLNTGDSDDRQSFDGKQVIVQSIGSESKNGTFHKPALSLA